MELLSNGTNVLLILAGFGLLIFVHELGHFLAARWAGIRCESFAVGMGPPILAWRRGIGLRAGSTDPSTIARHGKPAVEMTDEELERNGLGETEWSLRAFPLGGFVKMLGQDDLDPSHVSSSRRSYQRAPIGRRMVVVSAGVACNLALALALFVVAFLAGVRFEAPVVGMVVPGSPAATARAEGGGADGLRPGDTILSIDGEPVQTFADIQIAGAMARPGTVLEFAVARTEAGATAERRLLVTPERDRASGLYAIGIAPALSGAVGSVRADEQAAFDAAMRGAGLAPEPSPGGDDPLAELVGVGPDGAAPAPVATAALDRAAEESGGAPFATRWRTASGRIVERPIVPVPRFQEILDAATPGAAPDAGLLGLAPLLRVDRPAEGSANAAILRPGDVILRAGDAQGPRMAQLRAELSSRAGGTVPMLVLRDGRETAVEARVGANGLLGVLIAPALDLPVTAVPIASAAGPDGSARATPVAGLGLLPRTRIEAVDGTPVSDWASMRAALAAATREAAGRDESVPVPVTFAAPTPGHERFEAALAVTAADARALQSLGWASPVPPAVLEPLMTTLTAHGNPVTAVAMGLHQTKTMVVMTYLTLDRIARGSVGVEQLRGPVGIVHLGARVVDRGAMYLVFFLAMISVNLAVLNFLPLPIVDGGLFLYLLYERLTGRPPSVRFQNAATTVGLLFLGTLFLFTFYNDVMRIFTGS
jgi:regulator of sigma E protease